MGITTTIAKLKTYFEAWHKTTPHDDINADLSSIRTEMNSADKELSDKIDRIKSDLESKIYFITIAADNYNPKIGDNVIVTAQLLDYNCRPVTGKPLIIYKNGQEWIPNGIQTTNADGTISQTWHVDSTDKALTTFSVNEQISQENASSLIVNKENIQCYIDWWKIEWKGDEYKQTCFYHDQIMDFTFKTGSQVLRRQDGWVDFGCLQCAEEFQPSTTIYIPYINGILIKLLPQTNTNTNKIETRIRVATYFKDYGEDNKVSVSGHCMYKIRGSD